MEIWGHCPNCDRWFYCEAWLDRDAPEPACPVCLTEPQAIENRAATHHASQERAASR